MSTQTFSWHNLVDDAAAALGSLPDVSILSIIKDTHPTSGADKQIDAYLALEVLGQPARLLIEVKTYAYPRDLRSAARRIAQYTELDEGPSPTPMIVADTISPGGRDLLRDEGISYWDRSGSLYLKLPWALYYVDRPPRHPAPRTLRSIYRGSAAQVLHTLLMDPVHAWHVQELAAYAGVSVSRVHEVLSQLEQHLWVEKRGRGPAAVRVLVDPGALLDSWAEVHALRDYSFRLFHGWSQSSAALRSALTMALDRHSIPYALTLTSGAELVAPFATGNERLTLLVQEHPALEQATEIAGLSPVDDGENVALLVTRGQAPFLFRQEIDGLQVASTVQLYLDLWASPRRGKEQARHLRTERLPY